MKTTKNDALVERLTARLVAEGKLVEAGWAGYLIDVVPPNATPVEIENQRLAFYAGAHHLFESIVTMFGDDVEPSGDDIDKLDSVANELADFREWLGAQIKGHA